jgi:hypothetical protein
VRKAYLEDTVKATVLTNAMNNCSGIFAASQRAVVFYTSKIPVLVILAVVLQPHFSRDLPSWSDRPGMKLTMTLQLSRRYLMNLVRSRKILCNLF